VKETDRNLIMDTVEKSVESLTFSRAINNALRDCMSEDPNVVIGGQLIRYGVAGLTSGLYENFKERFITYSVSESLMNSSAMGLALAGKRVVMIHVRIDFLASGMCALVNHIPIWFTKGLNLPITMVCQVGKGMGQGAQHSKNLAGWFENFEGWDVCIPESPSQAYLMLQNSIRGNRPVMYVIHRELFDQPVGRKILSPQKIRLCGASQRHEEIFYGSEFISGKQKVKSQAINKKT
jgi:pyruvate/2-oxoglutarate/acetoin dehydrogenase E1 component